MSHRKLLLLFATTFALLLFFNAGPYKNWFDERILSVRDEIAIEIDSMDYEHRRMMRYTNGYVMSKEIVKYINTLKTKNPVILLPPQQYVSARGIQMVMPEPVVLYLFSGLKGVMPGNTGVYTANLGIRITDGQMMLVELHSKKAIEELLTEYKNL